MVRTYDDDDDDDDRDDDVVGDCISLYNMYSSVCRYLYIIYI